MVNRHKAAGKPEKAPLNLGGRFLHGQFPEMGMSHSDSEKCVAPAYIARSFAVRSNARIPNRIGCNLFFES